MTVKTDVVAEYTSGSGVTIDGVLLKDGLVDGVDVGAPFAGLLATGATVGATAQAQAFTLGVVSPFDAPAADSTTAWQVRKADGTTPIVTVDTTNGRVGIGTTAPKLALEVKGDDSYAVNTGATASGVVRIVTPNNVAIDIGAKGDVAPYPAWIQVHDSVNQANAYPLALQPNGGNVGIGTTAPATVLHVAGAATITGGIRPAADSTTALQLQNVAGTNILNVDTTNGRVGIGTSAPGALLELQTAIAPTFDGGFNNLGLKYSGGAAAGSVGAGIVFSQHADSTYPTVFVRVGGMYGVKEAVDGAYGGGLVFYTQPNGSAAMAERMRIGMSGNVGINDTAPAEALDVTGNINATGVYKVDDVQVLSNRVIDARCADVANSGDATTDGIIDALRDAMVAHGLIAAA